MSTMIATRAVYPVGYSTPGSQEYIDGLMSDLQALLIDTRISPKSWNADWCKDALQIKYGERYRWAGKFLGNKGLNTGRIEIADPVMGIKGLIKYLDEGHDLVLLCQCKQFEHCHVSHIVHLLSEQVHVDVIFQQPETQETAFASKTEQLAIEIEEVRDVDPVAKQSHCAVCGGETILGEDTLLKSPSGREDSVYCEQHGHCSRCGESVEKFVKHPYIVNYVCPCVAAYYENIMRNEEIKQAKPIAFSF